MTRWLGWMGVGLLAVMAVIGISYWTVPRGNTEQTSFDAIIVLGSPADPDGKPSVEQRERVREGVEEFRRGHAERLILTGGAAHNKWIEGWTEAQYAESLGVPADDVYVEGRSLNTIQNVFYAWQMMHAHGWTSAEVVSSHSHLPRAGLILSHYEKLGLKWHTQASHWPREYPVTQIAGYYWYEAVGTALLRWFGYRPTPFLP